MFGWAVGVCKILREEGDVGQKVRQEIVGRNPSILDNNPKGPFFLQAGPAPDPLAQPAAKAL
eukprot:12872804-Heterocapsa_arctica.AAC.1